MAMVIQHNAQAQMALGELNKNVTKVGRLLGKVSSGQKINSAQDDASSYVISEKMREQIRTLLQDNENAQNGSALFKIAEGGIDSIVEELRNLKELAINSANDTNTDVDRLTIQKVFNQKMANINDIATQTEYNTKKLLDGTWGLGEVEEVLEEPTEPVTKISASGNYTIDSDGVYVLPSGYSGTVTVNAKNVKITQADSETSLTNVSIVGPEGGNANLWIEDLNITYNAGNILKFQGKGNILTAKGTNIFNGTGSYAVVNIGGGLAIRGEDEKKNSLTINHRGTGAGIGGDYEETVGELSIAKGVNLYSSGSCGASIGSGKTGVIGNITIYKDATISINAQEWGAGIGSGETGGKAGIIKIASSAAITISAKQGAGIGSGAFSYTTQTVKQIILGNGFDTSKITHSGAINDGQNIGKGYNSTGPVSVSHQDFDNDIDFNTTTKYMNPLKIHHGPKANQATNFYINDMHTKSLGTGDLIDDSGMPLNEEDLERYDALSYDEDLQNDWLTTLSLAQDKTLDDVDVITKRNANIAIRVIDGAIDYALNEATRIGSYLQRLDYTDANLVTMNENIQAAESTIRDADMAKEMTEYTKFNVLQQSAQAMLAQANQNSSGVLSLLQ